jgi:predicted DNA-binding antitoxin AbrB/MazE fold protein
MPRGVAVKDPSKVYIQVRVDKEKYDVFKSILLLTHKGIDETLDEIIDNYIQVNGAEYLHLDKVFPKKKQLTS